VYQNATHPPETFRLEQFGLPDVADQPRAAFRRTAAAFIVAGVIVGGLVLAVWARGRRSPVRGTEVW
jgi:hypothetical protein